MIIQHNIMALNSYNRLGTNNNAVQKNLEKLSSGYRINRAGDDAAGLAISEKMRAQITGLERAQLNAKDGISLVQTAEGALTEVHSMLNRLVELGVESANGIYQATDRDKIQAEVDQITEEIDRISEGTNFNGLKLLDGSLREDAPAAETKPVTADISSLAGTPLGAVETVAATAAKSAVALTPVTFTAENDIVRYTVEYTDKDGKNQSVDIEFQAVAKTAGTFGASANDFQLKRIYRDADGNIVKNDDGTIKYGDSYDPANATNAVAKDENLADALAKELVKDETFKAAFDAKETKTDGVTKKQINFVSADKGANGASIRGIHTTLMDKDGTVQSKGVMAPDATKDVPGENEFGVIDLSKVTLWDGEKDTLEDAIFEINGKKFLFYDGTVTTTLSAEQQTWLNDIGVENNHVKTAAATAPDHTEVAAMAEKINKETGLKTEAGQINTTTGAWDATGGTQLALKDGAAAPTPVETTGTRGLTLQVGDTNEDFNKVTVYIDDMSSKGLGIDDLDVTDQGISGESIDRVKAAIVLVQAAQSMLAQANQQPQQVLQLLR